MLKILARDPAITLCTLAGVPIRLHASCVLLPLWGGYAGYVAGRAGWRGAGFMVLFVLLLYISASIHELGHILPARHFGARVRRIRISGMGAFVQLETFAPATCAQEVITSLGGPVLSALLSVGLTIAALPGIQDGGLAVVLGRDRPALLALLMSTNILLTAFNLLPVFPMDGGRALYAVLIARYTPSVATRVIALCGQVIALLMLAGALVLTGSLLIRAVVALAAGLIIRVAFRRARLVHVPL